MRFFNVAFSETQAAAHRERHGDLAFAGHCSDVLYLTFQYGSKESVTYTPNLVNYESRLKVQ